MRPDGALTLTHHFLDDARRIHEELRRAAEAEAAVAAEAATEAETATKAEAETEAEAEIDVEAGAANGGTP
jgi:hypothetical protein